MENTIFLQQDASEKIKVTIPEDALILYAKRYFRWRKDITVSRINKLGTSVRDRFISALQTHLEDAAEKAYFKQHPELNP